MKLNQGLKLLTFMMFIVLFGSPAHAVDNPNDYPLVELELRQDILAPYKERRSSHGFQMNVSYEPVEFLKYKSFLDGVSYKEMFGDSTTNIISLSAEYKYNFVMGAVSLGGVVGMGSVSGPSDRSLALTKYGLRFKYTMDNIFSEPYVAPYLGMDLWQMSYNEKLGSDTYSGSTQLSYNYSVGMLIQLNWIDKGTATNATYEYGLENTYLDLYATQYSAPQAEDDPDLGTDFSFGAGLLFEF